MHQLSFSQGLSWFFQRPAHCPGADTPHYLPLHQLVSQQMQRPTGPALWWLGAGQGHQVGLPLTVQLLRATVQLFLASQGPFQALFHAPPAHPFHCGGAYLQGLGYFLVLHGPSGLALIAEQQYAGVSLPVCRRSPFRHQPFKLFLLRFRQMHPVFLRHHFNPANPLFLEYRLIIPYQPSVQRWWSTRRSTGNGAGRPRRRRTLPSGPRPNWPRVCWSGPLSRESPSAEFQRTKSTAATATCGGGWSKECNCSIRQEQPYQLLFHGKSGLCLKNLGR